jgi:5-oxoprolinase (ATP-hydrolysing) subunit A
MMSDMTEDATAAGSTDLNCDMGEGFGPYRMGPDAELLGLVTSASIACGFHAGDPRIMDATVAQAARRGVAVGAHVSYPDLAGFGRRHLKVSSDELITDTLYQIGALDAFCRRHGTSVRYVKAHGALYNDLAGDETLAAALAEAVGSYDASLAVLVLAGSTAAEVIAGHGIRVVSEGFADRAYTPGGRLVSRREPGAVITDPGEVAERGVQIAAGLPVSAHDGTALTVRADSICVHGDTEGAVALATALRTALAKAGILCRPFTPATSP